MFRKVPSLYIMGNDRPTLYIGIASDLTKRVLQHKNKAVEGFTKRYHLTKLLYYEVHPTMKSAIKREKQMKKWKRQWKLNLIEDENPEYRDLYLELIDSKNSSDS